VNTRTNGQRVLVQGASRGIGLGFVRALLERAEVAQLHATCRAPQAAEALQALQQAHPGRLFLHRLDVTEPATIEQAAGAVAEQTDRLHRVVNASGMLHQREAGVWPEKHLKDVSLEALQAVFAVNAHGPLLVARAFDRLLCHDEPAVFACVSARVGSIGDNRLGGWYAYRASKAALNQYLRTLAIEWRRRAPRVTAVALHPGTTDTGLSEPFQARVPEDKLFPVERTVRQLLAIIDDLAPEDSGRFIAWDGRDVPW